jgi:glyoxylase-like metal-dependent hydrolase (beta-lactamase superfamily II)
MHGNIRRRWTSLLCLALSAGTSGAVAAAQGAPAPAPPAVEFSEVQVRATNVAGNLYALEGEGGTVSVLAGPDGALLIDSQYAPLTDRLVAAIRGFSQAPLRFLVNTHAHGDHTGGNANFARLGATILAHEQVRERMQFPPPGRDGRPGTPAVVEALPVVTIAEPTRLHLNGQEVFLLPMPPAHTDGDVMIAFPGLDVLVVGDFYRTVGYPVADRDRGGRLRGIIDALGIAIGHAGPKTRVVPGHGPISDRAGLIATRDMLSALYADVQARVAGGATVEELLAARPTAAWDASVPQGAQTSERFLRTLHAEIQATPR